MKRSFYSLLMKRLETNWMVIKKLVAGIFSCIMPAVVTIFPLVYFTLLQIKMYFRDDVGSIWWTPVLILPPLILDLFFTRYFEINKHGLKPLVVIELIARIVFISVLFNMFIWKPVHMTNVPDNVNPLLYGWPYLILFFWSATPIVAFILGFMTTSFYLLITCRLRLMRFSSVIVFPGVATYILFSLFYFLSTSPLRLETRRRPDFVKTVFSAKDFSNGKSPFNKYISFGREVYVDPNDSFVFASFGPTFGDTRSKPNAVWFDLKTKEYEAFEMSAVKHFYSECQEKIFFAPWHQQKFYSFEPNQKLISSYSLPKYVDGFPVFEIFFVYHACEAQRVYLVTLRNPNLFIWDSSANRLLKTINFVGKSGLSVHDYFGDIARNPHTQRVYVIALGMEHSSLIEIDEQKMDISRVLRLPGDSVDVSVSNDGKNIYISGFYNDAITIVDAEKLITKKVFKSPRQCRRIALSKDDKLLFVNSFITGEFLVYDAITGKCLMRMYITPKPEGLYVTDKYVYVLGAEGLFKISNIDIAAHIGNAN